MLRSVMSIANLCHLMTLLMMKLITKWSLFLKILLNKKYLIILSKAPRLWNPSPLVNRWKSWKRSQEVKRRKICSIDRSNLFKTTQKSWTNSILTTISSKISWINWTKFSILLQELPTLLLRLAFHSNCTVIKRKNSILLFISSLFLQMLTLTNRFRMILICRKSLMEILKSSKSNMK